MANEKEATAADDSRVAELEKRVTAMEQMLAEKIPGFEQVSVRVAELSTAFQQANRRLSTIQAAVEALQASPVPAGEEAVQALSARLDEVISRLDRVEQTRVRGGRLSSRLGDIESKLETLINQEGGSNDGNTDGA